MRIERDYLSRILKGFTVVGLLAMAEIAAAQTSTTSGALGGLVRDPNGAAVPDAKVTLVNASLGIQRVTTTTSEGTYIFPLIQPGGGYEVERRRGPRQPG